MARRNAPRRGFTLIELLVVIGIIVLLVSILVPVVSSVRKRAFATTTQAQMQRLATAIQAYYHDFNAYPGPLPNSQLMGSSSGSGSASNIPIQGVSLPITSSENLVLGLLGYLNPDYAHPNPVTIKFAMTSAQLTSKTAPTHDVLSLNPLQPKSYHYIDFISDEISLGQSGLQYSDTPYATGSSGGAKTAMDTNVPEFLDKIPDPMPILYMRANVGAQTMLSNGPVQPPAQYDFSQLAPYGFKVKVAADLTTASQDHSDDAVSTTLPPGFKAPAGVQPQEVNYFMNPGIVGQAKGKDGFILISAGLDRIYGTKDDIIVTP